VGRVESASSHGGEDAFALHAHLRACLQGVYTHTPTRLWSRVHGHPGPETKGLLLIPPLARALPVGYARESAAMSQKTLQLLVGYFDLCLSAPPVHRLPRNSHSQPRLPTLGWQVRCRPPTRDKPQLPACAGMK
jgi:hypothetical protein